jgi:hypothetical protein
MTDDGRITRIEHALLAIGEYVAHEGDRGFAHDQKREAVLRALDGLRQHVSVRAVASAHPNGQVTEAPGATLGPTDSGGDAVDPVPPNLPTTYLENATNPEL